MMSRQRVGGRRVWLVLVVCLLAAAMLLPSIVPAQEAPPLNLEGPTLKPSPPPMPPPATVPGSAAPQPLAAAGESGAVPSALEEKPEIQLNLENANMAEALKMYSDLTRRTVIATASLPGTVTIHSKTLLTRSEAILALESVMFANGVSVTPMGDKFVKAAINQNIAREGVALSDEDPSSLPEADRITAQIISLRYLDVGDTGMVESLRQFTHQPGGILIPLQRSNSILVIDTALTIRRLQEVLSRLDQPVENRVQTRYFPLKNAEAAKVAQLLQSLIGGTQPAPGRPAAPVRPGQPPVAGPTEESVVVGKVIIQSDERTNTLIIMSRPSNFEFLEELIAELDRTVEPEIRFKAFKLAHAKADEVADLIIQLTGGSSQPTIQRAASTRTTRQRLGGAGFSSRSRARTTPETPQPQLPPIAVRPTATVTQPGQQPPTGVATPAFVLSERARVIPDLRQGTVLALGTASDLELIERIIPELDLQLAQVIIESVIVEVKLDKNTEFGVNILQREWRRESVKGGGASLPAALATNLLQKLTFLGDPSQYSAAGLSGLGGLTYFLELGGLDLDVIVRAVAGGTNFRILQKPLLQSSQNQPAHIFVGETRPIVTATQTGFTSGDTTIPVRSSIEQFDIGVTLDITPNITPGGLVELEVEQVIEDVTGSVLIDGNVQPIVSRRELTSLVSVQNRGVVALGGLIRSGKTKTENKVPVVGDIPLLGMLFKQTRWEDSRIELIVFLRPTVLHSADDAQSEAQKLRQKFKGLDTIPNTDLPPLPKQPRGSKQPS